MSNETLTIRPLANTDHAAALDLWDTVFDAGRSYFERYYEFDPYYREGDTIGAWDNETRLVSAVHVCRRPLVSDGRSLLCGGIANVATLREYRARGLSGQLLTAMIRHMEQSGMHLSMLGTGIAAHYARAGWETLPTPTLSLITPASSVIDAVGAIVEARPTSEIITLYSATPRKLQLERTSEYFASWVATRWQESPRLIIWIPNKGYAVVETFTTDDGTPSASIQEFRAVDANAEHELLVQVLETLSKHTGSIRLHAIPQFIDLNELAPARAVFGEPDSGLMIRNLSLAPSDYAAVKEEYSSGRAVWWPADGF